MSSLLTTKSVDETSVLSHSGTREDSSSIPEHVQSQIFEPFYTTKEMGKGTGLGLSVSYGIVRHMNCTIVAENIGDGAQFTITLPIAN